MNSKPASKRRRRVSMTWEPSTIRWLLKLKAPHQPISRIAEDLVLLGVRTRLDGRTGTRLAPKERK